MDIRWGMISIDFMPHFLYKRVFELYKFKQFLGVGRFSAATAMFEVMQHLLGHWRCPRGLVRYYSVVKW